MALRRSAWITAALALAASGALAQTGVQTAGQTTVKTAVRLMTMGEATLVDCAPVTQTPCMSAGVLPVDANGAPAGVELAAPAELPKSFTVRSLSQDGTEAQPFYVSAGEGPDAEQHSSVVLMLVDISGSMNQPAPGSVSRFAAVKSALSEYLNGMRSGDRVAIVPFESHNVVSTIRNAVYATNKADALSELNALPQPQPKNNTALYQAVFTGVQSLRDEVSSLEREGRGADSLEPHLIVMTDGRNEVLAGDDAQLLNGDLGLQQAAEQVQVGHLDVIGIGFGDKTAIDAAAMTRLSRRFFYAQDAAGLLAALHVTRSAVSHILQLTWLLPAENRLGQTGRDEAWTVTMAAPGGAKLTSDAVRWVAPATAAPGYGRRALAGELQALILVHPSADSGWSTVLVETLILLGAAVLLLVLWFWVPRLVWGDRAMTYAPSRKERWTSDRPAVTSASGVQVRTSSSLPAGFDPTAEGVGPIQRSAAQTTQIQPRSELSRTRLTFER